ncbi:MAG: hypothetical protein ACR2P4_01350 [Gammaproteobacteria bacterium]
MTENKTNKPPTEAKFSPPTGPGRITFVMETPPRRVEIVDDAGQKFTDVYCGVLLVGRIRHLRDGSFVPVAFLFGGGEGLHCPIQVPPVWDIDDAVRRVFEVREGDYQWALPLPPAVHGVWMPREKRQAQTRRPLSKAQLAVITIGFCVILFIVW